jgi:hypothetical protein
MNLSVDSIHDIDTNHYSSCEGEMWTEAYLVDRLKEHLATVKRQASADTEKFYDSRKYYSLAHHLLVLGAFSPVGPFPINVSDLSAKLLQELSQLDKNNRKYVLKQAIGRIFEDMNCKLYHDSISRVLEVILVD